MSSFLPFIIGVGLGIGITLFLLRESIFKTTQLTEEEAEWIKEIINYHKED